MSKNKFNFKDKKTKIIISSTITIVLLLFIGIGLGLSSMNNTDSKNIASQGQSKDKTENKEKDEVVNKSNKEVATEDNKEVATEDKKEEIDKVETEKTSSNNSNAASSNNSESGNTSNSGNGGSTSTPQNHSHSWSPITETVHHEEQGHNEEYVIKEAWTETKYEYKYTYYCNSYDYCGFKTTSYDEIKNHNKTEMIRLVNKYEAMVKEGTAVYDPKNGLFRDLNGNILPTCGGWNDYAGPTKVPVGVIEHPAEYGTKWVVDKAAWTETVITGYKCGCGATK